MPALYGGHLFSLNIFDVKAASWIYVSRKTWSVTLMQVLVLGSAAGGGFPQWNCNCTNCESVRQNREGYTARTQSSIAISSDGKRWLLCNASPDIRSQLNATPELWPNTLRGSGIAEVLLVDAQVDHVTGLYRYVKAARWISGAPQRP